MQFLHQVFNVSSLLLDALKPATPLTNGAINETWPLVSGVAGLSTGEEKEEEIKKKPHQLQNLMSASAMQGGHKNRTSPKTSDSGKKQPQKKQLDVSRFSDQDGRNVRGDTQGRSDGGIAVYIPSQNQSLKITLCTNCSRCRQAASIHDCRSIVQ